MQYIQDYESTDSEQEQVEQREKKRKLNIPKAPQIFEDTQTSDELRKRTVPHIVGNWVKII